MENKLNQKIIFSKKLENLYIDNSVLPLCASLFSAIERINHFVYVNCYDDGRMFIIGTAPEYTKNCYTEGVYIAANELNRLRQMYGSPKRLSGFYSREIALTDDLDTKDKNILNIALGERFNIEKRFYMIKKEKDYTEMIGIGTNKTKKIQDFMQLCQENIYTFNAFIDYFKTEGKNIINVFKNEMVISPYKIECKQESHQQKYYDFKTSNRFSLSPREYECLESMSLGRSMKETAHELNLSPRTVEIHISNTKLKTGLYTKSQLVSFFNLSCA
jgi:DNA-binding CsgD family transcriptional regulator